jgi:hypothetical protein
MPNDARAQAQADETTQTAGGLPSMVAGGLPSWVAAFLVGAIAWTRRVTV